LAEAYLRLHTESGFSSNPGEGTNHSLEVRNIVENEKRTQVHKLPTEKDKIERRKRHNGSEYDTGCNCADAM
jgi:hypothetical protein